MVPAPYSFKWTLILIKRDIKIIAKNIKTKVKDKARKVFRKSKSSFQEDNDGGCCDPESNKPSTEEDIVDESISTLERPQAYETSGAFDFDFTSPIVDYCPNSETQSTDSGEEPGTFYDIMNGHLNDYWHNRPKNLQSEERYLVRGLRIFLHLALLNCPSDPSYVDLDKGQACFDHVSSMIGIMEHMTVTNVENLLSNKPFNGIKVSKMPRNIYEGEEKQQGERVDSLMKDQPDACELPNQIEDAGSESGFPSPPYLWYALMVACQERSKTQSIVEGILHLVEPEMDVRSFLVRMGDPGQMVPGDEKEMLRRKLRAVFFPEFVTVF